MTKVLFGCIIGFLLCVWALDASPGVAASTLWSRLAALNVEHGKVEPGKKSSSFDLADRNAEHRS